MLLLHFTKLQFPTITIEKFNLTLFTCVIFKCKKKIVMQKSSYKIEIEEPIMV